MKGDKGTPCIGRILDSLFSDLVYRFLGFKIWTYTPETELLSLNVARKFLVTRNIFVWITKEDECIYTINYD